MLTFIAQCICSLFQFYYRSFTVIIIIYKAVAYTRNVNEMNEEEKGLRMNALTLCPECETDQTRLNLDASE